MYAQHLWSANAPHNTVAFTLRTVEDFARVMRSASATALVADPRTSFIVRPTASARGSLSMGSTTRPPTCGTRTTSHCVHSVTFASNWGRSRVCWPTVRPSPHARSATVTRYARQPGSRQRLPISPDIARAQAHKVPIDVTADAVNIARAGGGGGGDAAAGAADDHPASTARFMMDKADEQAALHELNRRDVPRDGECSRCDRKRAASHGALGVQMRMNVPCSATQVTPPKRFVHCTARTLS